MKKNLPRYFSNTYLVLFSALVIIALVLSSFLFWDDYFKEILGRKRTNLIALLRLGSKEEDFKQPEVGLSFNLKSDSFIVGQESEIEIIFDSREKEIWGVDLKLVFDPARLKVKKIIAGSYFQKPLTLDKIINKEEKEILYSVGSLSATKGKGAIAILVVEPLEEGNYSISFSKKTQVALKGKSEPAIIDYRDSAFSVLK